MSAPITEASPNTLARIGGALYLYIIGAGLFGEAFVRNRLIVAGDADATASNILGSELLLRSSIASELLMYVCAVTLALIFYLLLKPVSRNLALLALLLNLVSVAVEALTKLNLFSALFYLGSADYLRAFDPQQLHALAYLALRSHTYGFATSLLFFGFECLVVGYLVFRSGYLPRVLGALMFAGGGAYVINSLAIFVAPPVSAALNPWILLFPFIGETSFCLWLLVKGVNMTKWKAQATARNVLANAAA